MSRISFSLGRTGVCAAVLLLSTSMLMTGCKSGDANEQAAKEGDKKEDKAADAVPVEVAKAARRAVAASYTGTAALEPRAESQVVAKTSGVALQVLVEEGQKVHAGQQLVRLDPDRARLAMAQSEAAMRKLENNYQRANRLVGQQLVSAAEVDQLKFDVENARARVPNGGPGAELHHGGGADQRRDRLAFDQGRQLRPDQHADLPHRR